MPVIYNGVRYPAADAHAHIYPEKIAEKATASVGSFYGLHMEYVGLPSVLVRQGAAAGIDRFLVCSVATKAEQVPSINRFIAEACAQYPSFVGLAAWHQDWKDVPAGLEAVRTQGLRGLKLHPDFQEFYLDSPDMFPLYQAAAEQGLPILFHMGDSRTDFSSPIRLARVLDRFPQLVCIAAHLGGYTQWRAAQECLQGGRVYTDCSSSLGFLTQEQARESIAHFGTEKVLFGTDFPMWPIDKELARFFALELSEEENRRILYDNFAGLFGLEASPCG